MHNIQRITNKQRDAAALLKERIIQGEIGWNDDRSKKLQSATLRRLMGQDMNQKPLRQNIIAKKKEIELIKFKVMLLNQEKSRKVALLRHKTETSKTMYDENSLRSKLNVGIL